jgi:hypothetical protein
MLRTSRTFRRGARALRWLGEWRLPPPERRAARAERETERRLFLERDDFTGAPWERRERLEAERRRWAGWE